MDTIINFSNKKRIRTLYMGFGITLLPLAFLYFIIFVDSKLRITYLLFFFMLFCAGVFLLFTAIRDLLNKDKTAVVLSNTGITSRANANGKKIGMVPWADISGFTITTLFKEKYLSLVVKDKAKYLDILKGPAAKQLIEESIILNISAGELELTFDELYKLVESYFSKHQSHNSFGLDR